MAPRLSSSLQQALAASGEPLPVAVDIFVDRGPLLESIGHLADRRQRRLAIEKQEDLSQAGFVAWLRQQGVEQLQVFRGAGAVHARVTRQVLDRLVTIGGVTFLDLPRRATFEAVRPNVVPDVGIPLWASGATPNLVKIGAPEAWKEVTGEGVVVAVLDTGVAYTHPCLAGRMWDGTGADFPHHGYDFAGGQLDPVDLDGHGTLAAGLVAGDGAIDDRPTGVAPGARVMALRIIGANVEPSEHHYWDAIDFAVDHDADVISMSAVWPPSLDTDHPGWRNVCDKVLTAGVLHSASVGNLGDRLQHFPVPGNVALPASCPPPFLHALQLELGAGAPSSVISCGAAAEMDDDWLYRAALSAIGPTAWTDYPWSAVTGGGLIKPDLCAPGTNLHSLNFKHAVPGEKPWVAFGDTSAATAQVAGAMALLVQACHKAGRPIDPAEIQQALEAGAVKMHGQTAAKENGYGAGRLYIPGALAELKKL